MKCKNKIKLLVLFLTSLLTFLNFYNLKCQGFQSLQNKFLESHNDVERSLVIEGKSNEKYENLSEYLFKNISNDYNGELTNEKSANSKILKINSQNFNMEIQVFNENKSSFRIIFSTKNKKENLEAVKKNINYLLKEKAFDLRYFQEIKGRIEIEEDMKKTLNKQFESLGIKKYSLLKISNGYTGEAELGNSTINFAICTYEKKSYIIIGEPIIISTY
ncbi:hypothetical protein [Clostridium sp. YIM B02551]|uniref:hypothetical protein n=1 Tax=Clostridium sp. YIM B02551 TaxID=2910679 RepID=UPI001EEAF5E8|nr:hypothetical protein [Clostridium sp. YIM B02551]